MSQQSIHSRIKQVFTVILILTISLVSGTACSDDEEIIQPQQTDPGLRMAVISDLHYYDPSLGMEGEYWNAGIFGDPKLLNDNDRILSSLFTSVAATDADIVLVAGDLTKDGERHNHDAMAGFLRTLEQGGKRVFVVPGNHDVNNPVAMRYPSDPPLPVPSVTAGEFASIYADFGYSEAAERDPSSLSYVVELSSDLWLLALDGCLYDTGSDTPPTSGAISESTASWITSTLQRASASNIRVIGLMHHSLIEHFSGESEFPVTSEYVIADWQQRANAFAQAGLQVLFTGHFHANDVTAYTSGDRTLYDISTGSPLSAPCPWRYVTLYDNGDCILDTRYVTNVPVAGGSFPDYAESFLQEGMTNLIAYMLVNNFGVAEEQATQMAPYLAGAYVANYAGDERMDAETQQVVAMLGGMGDPTAALLGQLIASMYTDLPPADNHVKITLN